MITPRNKSVRKAISAYSERKSYKDINQVNYTRELNQFCVNNCPHPTELCKVRCCEEFKAKREALKNKYNISHKRLTIKF